VSLEVITFYCLGGIGAGCNSALHDTALLVRLFCWLVSKSCTWVVFALLALLDVALFLLCRSFMFFVQAGLLSHISSSGLAYTAHSIPHTTCITGKTYHILDRLHNTFTRREASTYFDLASAAEARHEIFLSGVFWPRHPGLGLVKSMYCDAQEVGQISFREKP
jgi:hypothetical protein